MKLTFIILLFLATRLPALSFEAPYAHVEPSGKALNPDDILADLLTHLGQAEVSSQAQDMLAKRGAPQFERVQDVQDFVDSLPKSENDVDRTSLPYGTTKKCSDAPFPETCERCVIGVNVFFASTTAACTCIIKYGPVAYAAPLAGIPALAACITASTGVWYVNQISCLPSRVCVV